MKTDRKKDAVMALYALSVVLLALLYFMVPERKEFIEFQVTWWKDFWRNTGSFIP